MTGDRPLDRYLADSDDTPLTRESLRLLAAAVRAEMDEIRAAFEMIDPAALALDAIRPFADVERECILRAVRATGSVADAADLLGISRAVIYERLRKYGVRTPGRRATVSGKAS